MCTHNVTQKRIDESFQGVDESFHILKLALYYILSYK